MSRRRKTKTIDAFALLLALAVFAAAAGCRGENLQGGPSHPGAGTSMTPAGAGEPSELDLARGEMRREREALVATLAAEGIADRAVLDAIGRVPRHRFVPPGMSAYAYEDHALPIGEDQTISQPYIVAYMTAAMQLNAGAKVLEVGTGSGYQAAVLAELGAEVFSVEIIPELAARAEKVLAALDYESVHQRVGDGYAGWPENAPFDGIVVTAAAPRVPETLIEQLAPGARLVIPLGADELGLQWIWIVKKRADGGTDRERTIPVRFVPMTGAVQRAPD